MLQLSEARKLSSGLLAALLFAVVAGCTQDSGQGSGSSQTSSASKSTPPPDPQVVPQGVLTAPPPPLPVDDSQLPGAGNPSDPAASAHASQATARPQASSAANQTLFDGWPTPQVVLAFTGKQHGYIEPCGCTGLDRQKGGLARRQTFLNQLREERGWTVVPLDAGNQVRRFGRQAEIKFQLTVDGLKKMQYRGVGFGPDDLHLSIDELAAVTAQIGDEQTPFLSANIAVLDRDLTPRVRVIEAGGRRIGITTVLGDEIRETLRVDEVLTVPAAEGLKQALDELSQSSCDFLVLLAQATKDETLKIAQAVPGFHLVVTTGGGDEPSLEPESIPGSDARLIQVGAKGMYVVAVGLFDDPQSPWRYERIPLDARFADSPQMMDLMTTYQQQLERLGLEGLGVRPLPHPSGRKFVGSQACADCHTKAFAVWEKTPHAHATDSLVHPGERVTIPRHHDPECISCHVTGWEPQRFIPFDSGYLSLETTPLMVGNGCENCHGPGSAHVAAENGDLDVDEDMKRMLQMQMRLSLADAEKKCLECHDLDNSPDFHTPGAFEEYWKQILHVGKD